MWMPWEEGERLKRGSERATTTHWDIAKVEREGRIVGESVKGVEGLCGHADNHGALWFGLNGVGVDMQREWRAVGERHDDDDDDDGQKRQQFNYLKLR